VSESFVVALLCRVGRRERADDFGLALSLFYRRFALAFYYVDLLRGTDDSTSVLSIPGYVRRALILPHDMDASKSWCELAQSSAHFHKST
jgi:hypothetical protein